MVQQSHHYVARSKNHLKFTQERLNWSASIDCRKKLYTAVYRENFYEIVIDFSDVNKAYPNGIVPIIAVINDYKRQGIKFVIIEPSKKMLNRFSLKMAGFTL
jgi:hypothetical protein